jgi:hypothetical protein
VDADWETDYCDWPCYLYPPVGNDRGCREAHMGGGVAMGEGGVQHKGTMEIPPKFAARIEVSHTTPGSYEREFSG